MIDDISQLVYLHLWFHGYGDGNGPTPVGVTDAGALLPRLHKLVRADRTTRNKRRACAVAGRYDRLEERSRSWPPSDRVRPDLDGNQTWRCSTGGPASGEAWCYLKELRLERAARCPPRVATTELLVLVETRGGTAAWSRVMNGLWSEPRM